MSRLDRLNRRVAKAGADAGTTASVRSAAGDVTTTTDARGITSTIARDSLGRVVSVTPQGVCIHPPRPPLARVPSGMLLT